MLGNFGETRCGVGKSDMLEHKSSNISEKHKDRGKVTMEGLQCQLTAEVQIYTTLLTA